MKTFPSSSPSILLALYCRCQSGAALQRGFRLVDDDEVRAFGRLLPSPSSGHDALMFRDWETLLDSQPRGARIRPFTRELLIVFEVDNEEHVECAHLTIARNTRTQVARAQGWITAPKGTMLYRHAAEHVGRRLYGHFVPQNGRDTLRLPGLASSMGMAA